MKKLKSTKGMSHAEWLSWRRSGIGGSDAAALVGLSSWASPFTVYADKLGLLPEQEDNEAMRQGRDLEEYVAHRFCEETGKSVRRCNAILQHPGYGFILANVDRLIVGEDSGVECKTMNPRNPAAYMLEERDIPPQYYVQCQHYLAVTGYSKWYLAILVLGTEFYWFEIPKCDEDIAALIDAEVTFWKQHIIPHEPPPLDNTQACGTALSRIYPKSQQGTEIQLPDIGGQLERLEQIKRAQRALEDERRGIENTIKGRMKDAEVGHANGWRISYKNATRAKVDIKQIREKHPNIDWSAFTTTTSYRLLKVQKEGK